MAVVVSVVSTYNNKGVKQAIRSMDDFKKASKLAGGGFAGNMEVAGKYIDQVGQKMSKTGASMTRNMTLPLVAAGAALFKATQAAADDAKQQAILQKTLQNTTGATEAQRQSVESFITAQGKLYGVTDEQLRPALGSLATATGSVAKSQELATLAMDIAANKNIDVSKASAALSKAYAGQTMGLKRLLPGIDQAALKSGDFGRIQQSVADIVGGSAATASKTAAGQYQIMQVQIKEATESLGAAFLPIMTEVTTFINKAVIPQIDKLTKAFENMSPETKRIILLVGGFLAVLGPTIFVIGKVVSGIGKFVGAIGKAAKAFAFIMKLLAANPWVMVAIAVIALAYVIYKNWDKIKQFITNTMASIKAVLTKVWDAITAYFRFVFNVYKTIFTTAFNFIKSIITSVFNAIKNIITGVMTVLNNGISKVADIGKNIVKGIWDGISGMGSWLKDKVTGFAGDILTNIKDALGIASPSKKTYEYGQNLTQGLVNGLDDSRGAAITAAKATADAINLEMGNALANALTGTMNTENNPYYKNGKFDPDAFAAGLTADQAAWAKFGKTYTPTPGVVIPGITSGPKAGAKGKGGGKPSGGGAGGGGGGAGGGGSTFDRIQVMTDAATASLEAFKNKAKEALEFFKQIKDSLISYGSITQTTGDESFRPNAQGYVAGMQARLANIRAFGKNLKALKRLGLNNTSLQEIIAAGPDAGNQIASALLAQGKSAIGQVNRLESQIISAGAGVGRTATQSQFGMTTGQAFGAVQTSVNIQKGAVVVHFGDGVTNADRVALTNTVNTAVNTALAKAKAEAKRK